MKPHTHEHEHKGSSVEDQEHLITEMVHLHKRVYHLERSNKEMHDHDPTDKELQDYIKENEGYITKYKLRIQEIMDILIMVHGVTIEGIKELLDSTLPKAEEETKDK